MIDESLIQEHTGTSFSIEKIDGVSVMTFADNSNHKIDNNIRTALVFAGDCEDCSKYYNMYKGANWGDILVLGLGMGILPQYIKENKNPTSIDVIDNNQELIDHVDWIDNSINVIKADAYTYSTNKKYDIIIDDLYWDESEVTQQDKQDLVDNYRNNLNVNGRIIMCITAQRATKYE
jgi:hypothetical protein|tara:strand:- start:591 stop:1121 length:531 start_codon:yes stop_codon:yes gene_type:complete